jgi:hypothetical protein
MGEDVMKALGKTARLAARRRAVVTLPQDTVIRVSRRQYDEITADSSSPVESALVAYLRARNALAN